MTDRVMKINIFDFSMSCALAFAIGFALLVLA
jgi:hypothetical protein